MLWLRMALISEGAGDDAFLPAVLQRSAQQVCPVGTQVEDVLPVRAAGGPAPLPDVVDKLEENAGGFNLVAVHHDGAADPQDAHRRWIEALHHLWSEAGHAEPVVGVIPVRETEAWALSDVDALRRMLGRCATGESGLGLPSRGADLERLPDPKRTLRELFERDHRWDPRHLVRLGELTSLERLRALPSFRRWENDLAEALQMLPGFTKR